MKGAPGIATNGTIGRYQLLVGHRYKRSHVRYLKKLRVASMRARSLSMSADLGRVPEEPKPVGGRWHESTYSNVVFIDISSIATLNSLELL